MDGLAQFRAACAAAGVAEVDVNAFVMYAAGVLTNMGNYKSFGDTKIVPVLSDGAATVDAIVTATQGLRTPSANEDVAKLWTHLRTALFSLSPRERQLGLGASKGISTYFSYNCTESDAQLAQRFLNALGTNTRGGPLGLPRGGRVRPTLTHATRPSRAWWIRPHRAQT